MIDYQLLIAGVGGFVVGAGIATYVCYTMWYKNQKALLDEVDRVTDANEQLLCDLADTKREARNTEIKLEDMIRAVNEPDDDDALCEEDGVPDIPINECQNTRFVISSDKDVVSLWMTTNQVIEVYRLPNGQMYQVTAHGCNKYFFPEQVGGTGKLTACLAYGHGVVLDTVRGVVIHINQEEECDEEPDVYENELDIDNEEY